MSDKERESDVKKCYIDYGISQTQGGKRIKRMVTLIKRIHPFLFNVHQSLSSYWISSFVCLRCKTEKEKKKKKTEKFKAANVIFRLMLETWGRVNETDIGY